MTTYRIELRVEFLSVICHSAFFYPSIFLPVQRTIGYSVYACLCHKYAEQEKGESENSIQKMRHRNGSTKSREMKIQRKKYAKYHTNILNTLNQREFILSGRPKHMANRHTHANTNTLAFILLSLVLPSCSSCNRWYETLCYLLIGIGKVLQIFVN